MAYLTVAQADAILEAEGNTADWQDLDDAGKLQFLNRASRRIDAVPFEHETARPRFVDGSYADANGAAIVEQPMPEELQQATAVLARWYAEYPQSETGFDGIEDTRTEAALSPFLYDLPVSIQSVLMRYIAEEGQPLDNVGARKAIAAARRRPTSPTRGATAIEYTE